MKQKIKLLWETSIGKKVITTVACMVVIFISLSVLTYISEIKEEKAHQAKLSEKTEYKLKDAEATIHYSIYYEDRYGLNDVGITDRINTSFVVDISESITGRYEGNGYGGLDYIQLDIPIAFPKDYKELYFDSPFIYGGVSVEDLSKLNFPSEYNLEIKNITRSGPGDVHVDFASYVTDDGKLVFNGSDSGMYSFYKTNIDMDENDRFVNDLIINISAQHKDEEERRKLGELHTLKMKIELNNMLFEKVD